MFKKLTNEQIQKRESLASQLTSIASWLENSATKDEEINLNCEEIIQEANDFVKSINKDTEFTSFGIKNEREWVEKMGSMAKIDYEIYGKLWNLSSKKHKYGSNYQTWPENVLQEGIGLNKHYKSEKVNKIASVAVKLSEFLKEMSRNHQEARENYSLLETWTNYQKKFQEQVSTKAVQVKVDL